MGCASYLATLNPEQRRAVEHGVATTGANIAGPAARHRRCRLGKDQYAGAPGRAPDRARRRSRPHPASDLLAAGGRRDGPARAAHRRQRHWRSTIRQPSDYLVGDIPRRRRQAPAHARRLGRPRPRLHHARPRATPPTSWTSCATSRACRKRPRAFPRKATCLAIYSRAVNAQKPLEAPSRRHFPWCAEWETELRSLFEGYVEAKQAQHVLDYDDLLLYWDALMRRRNSRATSAARFDHVLVDEYQDTNALQAAILRGLKPDGAGSPWSATMRSRSIRFRAATRAQHPRFSRAVRSAGSGRHAGAELPLDAADPRRVQCRHRTGARALHQEPVLAPAVRREAAPRHRSRTKPARSTTSSTRILEHREAGIAEAAGGAVSHRAPQRPARGRAGAAQHSVRQVRRPQVPRGGARQGRAVVLRWAENPRDRVAGFRVAAAVAGRGPASREGARPHARGGRRRRLAAFRAAGAPPRTGRPRRVC